MNQTFKFKIVRTVSKADRHTARQVKRHTARQVKAKSSRRDKQADRQRQDRQILIFGIRVMRSRGAFATDYTLIPSAA